MFTLAFDWFCGCLLLVLGNLDLLWLSVAEFIVFALLMCCWVYGFLLLFSLMLD